ncbi:hypothetical protein Syun_028166 [Stephania yunnanensis]|uniref:Uncharacterized protein n=1 Tax=Stephania yunnanensis TaxID=152371 RepID=A0AAP0HRW4_9MAGN
MLKTAEQNIKKPFSNVLMVQKGKGMKKKGKDKAKVIKVVAAPVIKPVEQVKPQPVPTSKHPKQKEGNCHFYHAPRHWFGNYKLYLEDLKKKKGSETTTIGTHQK